MINSRQFGSYMKEPEIQKCVKELAKRINQDYKGKEMILVCVLKGAVVFLADLVREIKVPVQIEFVRLTNYGRTFNSPGTISIVKDIHTDIRGKHVLIVEEIIDSARTLRFLYERLKSGEPESVEIVSLLDKESKRVAKIPVKYVGQQVNDQFLIGYGLDLEEKCRNLREIYFMKYPN